MFVAQSGLAAHSARETPMIDPVSRVRNRVLRLGLATGVIALAGCGLFWIANASAQTAPPARRPDPNAASVTPNANDTPNPHWVADGCRHCHAMEGGKPQPIPEDKVEALCLSCHDGTKARAEVHPIGRPLKKETFLTPEGWPLGKRDTVTCLTCHDIKQHCDPKAERPFDNPTALRTVTRGGEEQPFCLSCHKPEQFPKFNPHIMLDPVSKKPVEDRCLTCHAKPFENPAGERTGEANLRADQLLLCRACHPTHRDQFTPGHIGHKVRPATVAFMKAREVTGLAMPPSRGLVDQLRKTETLPRLAPITPDGRVVCTSCHNPHEAGLFGPDAALSYRAIRVIPGKDGGVTRTRSPVRGELWCNHCHDMN